MLRSKMITVQVGKVDARHQSWKSQNQQSGLPQVKTKSGKTEIIQMWKSQYFLIIWSKVSIFLKLELSLQQEFLQKSPNQCNVSTSKTA